MFKWFVSSCLLNHSVSGSLWGDTINEGRSRLHGSPVRPRALFEHMWVQYLAQCSEGVLAPFPTTKTPSLCCLPWGNQEPAASQPSSQQIELPPPTSWETHRCFFGFSSWVYIHHEGRTVQYLLIFLFGWILLRFLAALVAVDQNPVFFSSNYLRQHELEVSVHYSCLEQKHKQANPNPNPIPEPSTLIKPNAQFQKMCT